MVSLSLAGPDELTRAWNHMQHGVTRMDPRPRVRGFLIQEWIGEAREFLVGIREDPQFGPVVACGWGGTWVEVLKDVSLRLPPLTRSGAADMVAALKCAPLLGPFRGKPPADAEALYDSLVRIGRMATDLNGRLIELDVNPLMVRENGKGVCAVDALVRYRGPGSDASGGP
jgi:acyl-CoA synthetase (NDP forming)